MSWLENIRKKPQQEKIRIIWTVSIVVFILLIALWVVTSNLTKNQPRDTSLLQTIGQGFHNIKKNYKK
jgi:Tfp pilus assembly protein PilN